MSLFKGSLSYVRFFVEGELPKAFETAFLREVQKRAQRPLEPDDEDLERSGWCVAGAPFELEFGHNDVFYNEFINLGFRTDKWVIPGPLLKSKLREAESSFLQKKGRERMTKVEKKELKELVSKRLRRQLSPSMKVTDLAWSLSENVVRFFSHSPRTGALMSELFSKTFGLKLTPEAPYTLAARLGLSKAEEEAWQAAELTIFGAREPKTRAQGAL